MSIGGGVSGARKQFISVEGSIGVVHCDVDHGCSGELGVDVGRAEGGLGSVDGDDEGGGRRA